MTLRSGSGISEPEAKRHLTGAALNRGKCPKECFDLLDHANGPGLRFYSSPRAARFRVQQTVDRDSAHAPEALRAAGAMPRSVKRSSSPRAIQSAYSPLRRGSSNGSAMASATACVPTYPASGIRQECGNGARHFHREFAIAPQVNLQGRERPCVVVQADTEFRTGGGDPPRVPRRVNGRGNALQKSGRDPIHQRAPWMETDTKKQRQHFHRDYASRQWPLASSTCPRRTAGYTTLICARE
jgi:hypothetical protein